jgi:thiamine transport system permease protein
MKNAHNNWRRISSGASVFFFLFIIFLPAIFILGSFTQGGVVLNGQIIRAVLLSFWIGIAVVTIDLAFGLPLAWMLSRSKSRIATFIDSLIDLSLVMPTAALGFSVYLYWGDRVGLARIFGLNAGLINKGVLMIILLHVVFTLPYIVRSIGAAIAQISPSYAEAAETLGAYHFTLFRSISLPLFRDGVINGSILAFTRSLSETGATMMVAGLASTAPVLVVELKNSGHLPQAMGTSIILIVSAILILFSAKALLGKKTISLEKVYPRFEKSLINLIIPRNILVALFFLFILFLPTIFIVFYNLSHWEMAFGAGVLKSMAISFFIASTVTLVNLIFALPLAYIIARDQGRLGKVLDTLNEIVLLVPTSALGMSLAYFWHKFLSFDLLVLILTHLSFSFPFLIKPLVATFRDIPPGLEDAAYSLGARSGQMLRTILLPMIKPAILAGLIMAFMRSLSETGATLAVSDKIQTVPILIVDLVKQGQFGQAAFISTLLFIIALAFLFVLKHLTYRTK